MDLEWTATATRKECFSRLAAYPSPMDVPSFTQPPPDLPWLEICIFFGSVIFLVTFFNNIVLSEDKERPVSFKVPIPEQCNPDWKGDLLEDPNIKVPSWSTIIILLMRKKAEMNQTDPRHQRHPMLQPSQRTSPGSSEPSHR